MPETVPGKRTHLFTSFVSFVMPLSTIKRYSGLWKTRPPNPRYPLITRPDTPLSLDLFACTRLKNKDVLVLQQDLLQPHLLQHKNLAHSPLGRNRKIPLPSNSGLQAFSAENLLCILQLLILLTFRHQVIKKGIRKPLHFGLQNQGFLPMREPIIYESLCDQYEQ